MAKYVGIITFHASHNYGSMLQAYALQQIVLSLGLKCEIINFRTERQKLFYQPAFNRGTSLGKIKRYILLSPYLKSLKKKNLLFEDFLKNNLHITSKEYNNLEDLENENLSFDFYISGSDQIWNTYCFDFDWAYFLPFVSNGKKIAYAPSMGPVSEKSILPIYYDKIKQYLSSYTAISVREEGTANWLKKHCGLSVDINLDPTLLLNINQWNDIIEREPLIDGDYIFIYSPFFNPDLLVLADLLLKRYNMRVVISQVYDYGLRKQYKFIFSNNNVVVKCDVGPKEFLNLCKYARLVCGYSFHLVVFSILFHKPFLTLDGMLDNRISNLLELLGLQDRSVSLEKDLDSVLNMFDIDFQKVDSLIKIHKEKSITWLKNQLT